ncbi:MAG: hypothetical protein J6K20_00140 [Thermoguttaceae bacterium]|nr:hypothetical protein [Thermoguttaceae bacterium]
MKINGVKLPTRKEFDAASRTFCKMFNDGPSLDSPRCYVEYVDWKLNCRWGATDEGAKLFSNEDFEFGVDTVVLTSAFLYSKVFPLPTATIREVRHALAEWLSHFSFDSKEEIIGYYIDAYSKKRRRRNNAEN